MRNIQFWRLRDDDFQAIIAIPKQIVVAKKKARAQRRSCCAKFRKDRLCRSAKRRAWQRLETNGKAAPSVPLPPFQNWITLHSPIPLAVFTGTACSLKSTPTRRDVLCRASQVYCEQTRGYLCANGLHAEVVPVRPCLKKRAPCLPEGKITSQRLQTEKESRVTPPGLNFGGWPEPH